MESTMSDLIGPNTVGRPVRMVSLSFYLQPWEKITEQVDAEGSRGVDLLVLPEVWTGNEPERPDGPTMTAMAALAQKHRMYIVCPVNRLVDGQRFNSTILIGRSGKICGIYDKVFPYWDEFDLTPPARPGRKVFVYETDFGKLGVATCFDANFPEVWQDLADEGAELVVWSSAYSGGRTLAAHAITHHYYIVTSTWTQDCLVYDITGDVLLDEKSEDINVSRITLDLDRGIYHRNFNTDKLEKLLLEQSDDVEREKYLEREGWFVLKAKRPGVSARKLAKEYGLEELRSYIDRSRREINKMRIEKEN
jgi:predicted amidohydrolase